MKRFEKGYYMKSAGEEDAGGTVMVKTSASLTLRLTREEETSEFYWGF